MSLAVAQVDALLQPLDDRRVRRKDGVSHLEAWDVRRHLIRVFGFGGFDIETKALECVLERSFWSEKPGEPFKGRHTVVYRAEVRLSIKAQDGTVVASFEDGAMGDGVNMPTLMGAHDFAMKTALSQALKRCAVNLGDRFGLSLYNKGAVGATVGKTLGNEHTPDEVVEAAVTDHVEGGELDEQSEQVVDSSSPSSPVTTEPTGLGTPVMASAETHADLRSRVLALPEDQRTVFNEWRKEAGIPAFSSADSLTIAQVSSAIDTLGRIARAAAKDTPAGDAASDLSGPALAKEALGGVRKSAGGAKKAAANVVPTKEEAVAQLVDAFPGSEVVE